MALASPFGEHVRPAVEVGFVIGFYIEVGGRLKDILMWVGGIFAFGYALRDVGRK